MRSFFAGIGVLVCLFVVGLGLPWLIMGSDFFLAKVFSPAMEDVRRETFEHSKAFTQGMIQELDNLCVEYAKADDAHKAALGTLARHRYADFSDAKLPAHLRQFLQEVRK